MPKNKKYPTQKNGGEKISKRNKTGFAFSFFFIIQTTKKN